MFRLLRLKPPHGWNAVAWELGIVTLGVIIALGAQQFAQSINDRSTASETRAEVTDELQSNLMSLALRQSTEPCIRRRLDELRAIVTQWEKTGTFATPKWVSQPPMFIIELSRYDAAQSAGRLALLSRDDQYRMGTIAARLRKFDYWQTAERVQWGRLRELQFGAASLSKSDQSDSRSALQDASTLDYMAKVNAAEALPMARKFGFKPDASGFREMAPQVWAGGKFTPSICLSIDTLPEEANRRVVVPLAL
jgi:hypothetical protein